MAKIINKKSAVPGKIPAPVDLDYGELALNYADGKLFYKASNNSIQSFGGAALSNAVRQQFTATAGQTAFSINYTPGQLDVYLNGVKLVVGSDYTATSGTGFTLTTAAAAGDIVDVVAGIIFASSDWQYITNKPTTLNGFGITDAQPLSTNLTAISVLSGTNGFVRTNGAGTWSVDTNTYITGNQNIVFSGDATGNGTTSVNLTLANSGVTAGLYGSATNIPQITVDAKGRITTVTNVAVSIPSGSLTFTGDVTGTGTTGSSTALTLANSGVTAGTYTKVTVDAKGRVTTGTTLASADLPTYTGTITSSQVTTGLGFTPLNPGTSQTANFVYAAPNGVAGSPTFRALVAADIPTLNQNTTGTASNVTGTVAIANGGTGATTAAAALTALGAYAATNPSGYISGNQTITFSGDATGSGTTAVSLTLANSGATAGTYRSVTVDAKGRVTAGTNPTTISGYGITDAYTKTEVDGFLQGLDPKASVRVATTANITLSGTQTIDGVAVVAGDRVLVKDQNTASQNGIYVVAAGAWTRSTDLNIWAEFPGAYVFVEEGTANQDFGFVCTSNSGGTLETTSITWVQFNGAANITAGTGLAKSGNTLSLATGVVTAGTYRSVTVDTTGRVTAGTNPTTLAGYGITDAQPLDSDLTAIAALLPTLDNFIVGNGTTWTLETPAQARASLGGTTVGQNIFTLTNPSAVTFLRVNADNTVSALDAATFRTAIGAGTSSTTGTVTSVSGTGTVSGLTLTGTVTSSGSLTLGGTLTLTSGQVTTALGYTPPQPTGTGASGTWGINVTGSSSYSTTSGSASTSTRSTIEDTRAAQRTPNAYDDYRASYEFTNQITGLGDWHTAFTMQGWHDGYAAWQIIGPASSSTHENWYLRSGINTTWNSLRTILHSGNYSSYALPLSGGTVTGNLTVNGTFTQSATGVADTYAVINNTNYYSWIDFRRNGTNYGRFLGYYGSGFYTYWDAIYFNNLAGTSWGSLTSSGLNIVNAITQAGNQVLHAGNYTSYSPSLTGSGASGTWGISISGNSATTSQRNFGSDIATAGQGRFTGWYDGGSGNNALAVEVGVSGGAGYVISYNRSTSSYGTLVLNGTNIQLVPQGGTLTGPSGNVILHAGNYTSYSPSLTGSGASGTWGINITGNAATVTNGLTTSNYSGYALPLTGGTVSGNVYLSANSQGANGSSTLRVNGDITAARGNGTTGVIFLGNSGGTYVYYDGGSYYMPNGGLINNGQVVLRADNYSSYALPLSGGTLSGDITFSNGRKGLVGVYDAAQTQAVFAMGPSYVLTNGGASNTYGNFYGLAWSYNPDYGGAGNNPQSKPGLNHQLLLMMAGTTRTALGSGVWTEGTVTALGNVTASGAITQAGNQVLHAGNYSSYALPLSGGTMGGTIYANAGSIIIGQNGGVTRGYLYNDSAGFGFLNNGGGWAAFVPYGTSNFQVNGTVRSNSGGFVFPDGTVQTTASSGGASFATAFKFQ